MHLLALSAFRLEGPQRTREYTTVSMHLLALSAFRRCGAGRDAGGPYPSQCTFWCPVLSDFMSAQTKTWAFSVSMHLLVLSAFRLDVDRAIHLVNTSLNAPFGAQCFPTRTA